jgi:hypothetical protein
MKLTLEANKLANYSLLKAVLLVLLFLILVFVWQFFIPYSPDWDAFQPAAIDLISGHNPYTRTDEFGFFNPPWALLPIVPFAVLPGRLGAAGVSVLGMFAFIFIAIRLKASPVQTVAIMLSAPVMACLYDVNIDWMVALGLIMPAQFGLFFVLVKPQAGLGIAVFWLFQALYRGGIKEAIRTFAPVTAAFLISFLLYGFYPAHAVHVAWKWNLSLWPYAIPVGLILLFTAVRSRKINNAVVSSIFLAPYVSIQSYSIPLFGLLSKKYAVVLYSVGTWVVFIVAALLTSQH